MTSLSKKNILYVGGIDDKVTEEILYAAFIPFGDLKTIQIPKDFAANKQRGFAFVEFESEEDAASAIDNMDGSELFGRVIRCNVAKAMPKLAAGKAVWNSEDWIQSNLQNDEEEDERVPEVTLVPSKMDDDERDQ